MEPLVSVIIPTYNRAKTIGRTINSLLLQTFDSFEIVVVDDGSKDDTGEILSAITDKRLRIVRHEVNKGVTAAKNTGLNNIHGEWFTILDSDDEIVPDTLSTMMQIPLQKDKTVTAVSCNCIDTSTNKLSGYGLMSDQYLDFKTQLNLCTGEFWGITKTSLLQNDRFNERLNGYEGILWYKINERAKRYYIHQGLRIYHTEGDDRVSKTAPSTEKIAKHYEALAEESHYLNILKNFLPQLLAKDCVRAAIYLTADKKKSTARIYYSLLYQLPGYRMHKLVSSFAYNSNSFIASLFVKILNFSKKI